MAEIRFRRLRLEGFGRYAQPVEVQFHDGINVYIAPNERGKSTLVAGIEAVLFGLVSDVRSTFSTHRYRCWYWHDRFSGALELEHNGKGWLLERAFDENRLKISSRNDAGEWRSYGKHIHNPRARRGNFTIQKELETLLGGVASKEIFEAIFCVPQLLPEGSRLSEEVRSLLSGGNALTKAQERIISLARECTRYTGDRGLTPRNGHNNGLLEQLDQKIQDRERLLCESTSLFSELEQKRLEHEHLQEQKQRLEQEVSEGEKHLEAFRRWVQLYEDYTRVLDEQRQLQDVLNEATKNAEHIEGLRERITLAPRWCQEADDAKLIVRETRQYANELSQHWAQLQRYQQQLQQVEREIDERYALFEQAPQEHRQLLERFEVEKSERQHRLEKAETEWKQQQQQRTQYEQRQQQYEQHFSDIMGITAEAVQRKIELLRSSSPTQERPNLLPVILLAASGGVLLAVGALANWLMGGAIGGLICWVIGFMVYRQQVQRVEKSFQARVSERENALKEVNAQLGHLADVDDVVQLGTLLGRVRQRDEEGKRLHEMQSELPSEQRLKQAEESLRQAHKEVQDFEQQMQRYQQRFGESLAEEFGAYRKKVSERTDLKQRLDEEAQFFKVPWEQISSYPCGEWLNRFGVLREALGLPNEEAPLPQLAQRLSELTEEFWDSLEVQAENYEQLRQQITQQEARLKGILGGKSIGQLQEEKQNLDNQAASILLEWRRLAEENPYLPPAEAREEQASKARERLNALPKKMKQKSAEQEQVQQRLVDIAREIGQLEGKGVRNIAKLQEEIEQLKQEKESLQLKTDALTEAYHTLKAAAEEFSRTYRQQLSQSITDYFNRFAPVGAGRRAELNEGFELQVYEGEKLVALSQLSCGAQDQLYLAVRFALADFLSDNVKMPFIFDDSFVHCDAERRENIREVLERVAQDRQIILLSHDAAFASWGRQIEVKPLQGG